jgi:hypothetical protein
MLMAGATVVGIGSAIQTRGVGALQMIHGELAAWLASRHLTVEAVQNQAHRERIYPVSPTGAPVPEAHSASLEK